MKKDDLKIVNGQVTVYLDGNANDRGAFSFKGVTIETKPNVFFKEYLANIDQKNIGCLNIVSLRDYIYSKLRVQADFDLKNYISRHINDMDFYTEKNSYDEQIFKIYEWDGKYPEVSKEINLQLHNVANGLINCEIANSHCVYDLIQDRFVSIKSSTYRDAIDVIPLNVFYGSRALNKVIAAEQYKRGIAHKAFTEVINLSNFLDGKKSIKIKLKNGEIHELKNAHGVSVQQLLELTNGKFYLSDNYNISPRFNKKIEVEELECLQFSKHKHFINTDNLVIEGVD